MQISKSNQEGRAYLLWAQAAVCSSKNHCLTSGPVREFGQSARCSRAELQIEPRTRTVQLGVDGGAWLLGSTVIFRDVEEIYSPMISRVLCNNVITNRYAEVV